MTYDMISRVATLYNENNDCAVRACAIALNKPYGIVWRRFKEAGRKRREGVKPSLFKNTLFQFPEIDIQEVTAADMEGRFIVLTGDTNPFSSRYGEGHVIAFINGKYEGHMYNSHRIIGIYKLTESK